MKKIIPAMILAACLSVSSAKAQQTSDSKFPLFESVATAQHRCPFDVVVWLNTKTDTYSVSGPGPNDTKETGAYMCQRDADQMDYHPASAPPSN